MNDDFEKRLQRVVPREIPSAWRAEILAAARTESHQHAPRTTLQGFLVQLVDQFRVPRVAWAALVAVWLVILGLHFSGGPESSTLTATSAVAADQTRQALKQKQLLLAELAEAVETQAPVRPAALPSPRSQRRDEAAVT
jgi:hypothetical protein